MQGMRSMTYEIIVFKRLRFRPSTRNDKPARIPKTPLWGPFPKTCVFVTRRLQDGRLKGRKKIPVFKYIQIRVDGT